MRSMNTASMTCSSTTLQRIFGGRRLHDIRVRDGLAQQRREAVAEQGMVVDDEQLHAAHIKESARVA